MNCTNEGENDDFWVMKIKQKRRTFAIQYRRLTFCHCINCRNAAKVHRVCLVYSSLVPIRKRSWPFHVIQPNHTSVLQEIPNVTYIVTKCCIHRYRLTANDRIFDLNVKYMLNIYPMQVSLCQRHVANLFYLYLRHIYLYIAIASKEGR